MNTDIRAYERFDIADSFKKEIYLPSPGVKVIIREMNGADEDRLTHVNHNKSGQAINNFLSGIIISPKISSDELRTWRVRDKYFVLFEAIRLTYGDTLTFEHQFAGGEKAEIEEDLSRFTWDFSDLENYPKRGEADYNEERIQPYLDNQTEVEFTLSSKKIVGFQYLTGELEEIILMGDSNDRQINDELRNRNFYIKINNVKQKISDFSSFKATEMREIRSMILKLDSEWRAIINCPHLSGNLGKSERISIFNIPDFFFPRLR